MKRRRLTGASCRERDAIACQARAIARWLERHATLDLGRRAHLLAVDIELALVCSHEEQR